MASSNWHFFPLVCNNAVHCVFQPFLPCRFPSTSQSRHLQCLKDTSIRNPFKLDKLTCNTFNLAEELLLYYYRVGYTYVTQLYAIIILQMCNSALSLLSTTYILLEGGSHHPPLHHHTLHSSSSSSVLNPLPLPTFTSNSTVTSCFVSVFYFLLTHTHLASNSLPISFFSTHS